MHKMIRWILGVLIACLLSACASTKYYDEQFSSLMVASDRSKVVVLGQQYHYVFDMPSMLDKSLSAGFRKQLSGAVISGFTIGKGGKTLGYFRLQLSKAATEADINEARALGYQTAKSGSIYSTLFVSGTRYKATPLGEDAPTLLNETYHVRIADSQGAGYQMNALSPIIVLGGGAFAIANPAMLLFTLPVIGLRP
jgi:hypothetical protein